MSSTATAVAPSIQIPLSTLMPPNSRPSSNTTQQSTGVGATGPTSNVYQNAGHGNAGSPTVANSLPTQGQGATRVPAPIATTATPTPPAPLGPMAYADGVLPRWMRKKGLNMTIATWLGLILAFIMGVLTFITAKWSNWNDFRQSCFNDLALGLISPACNKTLSHPAKPPPIWRRGESARTILFFDFEMETIYVGPAQVWASTLVLGVLTVVLAFTWFRPYLDGRKRPIVSPARMAFGVETISFQWRERKSSIDPRGQSIRSIGAHLICDTAVSPVESLDGQSAVLGISVENIGLLERKLARIAKRRAEGDTRRNSTARGLEDRGDANFTIADLPRTQKYISETWGTGPPNLREWMTAYTIGYNEIWSPLDKSDTALRTSLRPCRVRTDKNSGQINWYSESKGFGFITPHQGGKEIYVHHDAFKNFPPLGTSFNRLLVSYDLTTGPKGTQATNVVINWNSNELNQIPNVDDLKQASSLADDQAEVGNRLCDKGRLVAPGSPHKQRKQDQYDSGKPDAGCDTGSIGYEDSDMSDWDRTTVVRNVEAKEANSPEAVIGSQEQAAEEGSMITGSRKGYITTRNMSEKVTDPSSLSHESDPFDEIINRAFLLDSQITQEWSDLGVSETTKPVKHNRRIWQRLGKKRPKAGSA